MKILLIILFFIFFSGQQCSAQATNTHVLKIDDIPAEGIILNSGWRFLAGDKPEYAKADFPDEGWKIIDPTQDIHDIPELWKTNIGWLRLHLNIDSSVAQKPIAVLVEQTGASEIYFNGQLIGKFGTISNHPNLVRAAAPTKGTYIGLPANRPGKHVLAVRFAVQKNVPYVIFAFRPNSALVLRATEIQSVNRIFQTNFNLFLDYMRGGVFLILALLHLALLAFSPSYKANLYFFIYAILSAINSFLISIVYTHVDTAASKQWVLIAITIASCATNLYFLTAVYQIFNHRRGVIYRLIVAASALSMIIFFMVYGNESFFIINVISFAIFLECIRIAMIAGKGKRRGAKIVITGAGGSVFFHVLSLLFALGYLSPGPDLLYANFTFNFAMVILPISISIYLALEASFTSRSLQEKLIEVEQLSKKTIAQEQEKQQILASQKEILEKQVEERTIELKQSLEKVKATQRQLVQREKMASLGELTAGIAHEIQNPLNFVNNFSEVNKELISEMKKELLSGNANEAVSIADDIEENEQKINDHGKRADAIVKAMLQHSRASTGQKEPADINALTDEYLRLSYHGFRAKDKSFNATTEAHFDESIGKINVVPHDIGRVLLNLFNNAFYAVAEKKRRVDGTFEPVVSVSTKRSGDKVEIHVTDNGVGIPQKAVDKIFQPFFTTKPAGQGTGLGLSLSYDIIKAHGGELKVETTEGECAEFTIQLPVITSVRSS